MRIDQRQISHAGAVCFVEGDQQQGIGVVPDEFRVVLHWKWRAILVWIITALSPRLLSRSRRAPSRHMLISRV